MSSSSKPFNFGGEPIHIRIQEFLNTIITPQQKGIVQRILQYQPP